MAHLYDHLTEYSRLRGKQLWTAPALAAIPVLIATYSEFRNGASYLELGGVSVRSLQFIEWSILGSSFYVSVRLLRKGGVLGYLAWSAIYLAATTGGLGYVIFFIWNGNQSDFLRMIKIVLMDFVAPVTFCVAYRIVRRVTRKG